MLILKIKKTKIMEMEVKEKAIELVDILVGILEELV